MTLASTEYLYKSDPLTEHPLGIDDLEYAPAAGEDSSLLIKNLGGMREAAAAFMEFARLDAQGLVQWNGLQIIDRHRSCHSQNIAKFVELAHGIVKDGRDDAPVAVSRGAGISLAQTKARDEVRAGVVQNKLQSHPVEIVLAASETKVLFRRICFREMSMSGFLHNGRF